jgi:hypothetical protein
MCLRRCVICVGQGMQQARSQQNPTGESTPVSLDSFNTISR